MKKIFLIAISVLILTAIVIYMFMTIPKLTSSELDKTTKNIGELEDTNILKNNTEISSNRNTENNKIENSINKNEKIARSTNTLTNTTSNKTEDKNKTTTKTNTSSKTSDSNKKKTNVANNSINTVKSTTNQATNTTSNKVTTTNKTSSDTNTTSSKSTGNKKEEIQHKHFVSVNAGWFKTEEEAYNKFKAELEMWDKKYRNNEITWDELGKYCPIGYETYRCSCGMYGLEFSYE